MKTYHGSKAQQCDILLSVAPYGGDSPLWEVIIAVDGDFANCQAETFGGQLAAKRAFLKAKRELAKAARAIQLRARP